MSEPQPYDWTLPFLDQPPEPMWGASLFDVARAAAFQPAPHALGTQVIPPFAGQAPAPMTTTAGHLVHAKLPVARGLKIARMNRANVQDFREDFSFRYPSPIAHALQQAVHGTAGIVEQSVLEPFKFPGLSPSAPIFHNLPAPVQQAWSQINSLRYAVGQTADVQGTEQSFVEFEPATGPIDMQEIAAISWKVDQGILWEQAVTAQDPRLASSRRQTPPMNRHEAVQAYGLNEYLPPMAALTATSSTAEIPGEAFVSTNPPSTTTRMHFRQDDVQGHPYPGAMSRAQQGAYNHSSEYFDSNKLSINGAAACPPASYLQGQPYHPDPSLVPNALLASVHYQNHAPHTEQVGYATAEATGQSYDPLHPSRNRLQGSPRGHLNGALAMASHGPDGGYLSAAPPSSHEHLQSDLCFGYDQSPANRQATNALDEPSQILAVAMQKTPEDTSEERTLRRIDSLRYGVDPETGKPLLLLQHILDFVAEAGQYHRFCPVGRCTDVLLSEKDVGDHFRKWHPEVLHNSTSPVECPHLGCSQMVWNHDLEDHLRRKHLSEPINQERPRCLACNKTFTSPPDYVEKHLQRDVCKRRGCEECPEYTARNVYELREHRLGHLKDEQLEADEQPKAKKQKTTTR